VFLWSPLGLLDFGNASQVVEHTTARFGPGYQQGVNANTSASSSGPFQLHSTSTRPDVTLGSVARKWQIENRARQND